MKVDFIIAGAQKCGTTALHEFLSQHHSIIGSNPKETDFFNYIERYKKGLKFYHSYFRKRTLFERIFLKSKFLEASPTYITDGDIELTANRIFNYNNQIKIICIVRNPSERAYSAWNMYRQRYLSGMNRWWYKWMEERLGICPQVVPRRDEEWRDFGKYVLQEKKNLDKGMPTESEVLYIGDYWKGIEIFQKKFHKNFLVIQNEKLNNNTSGELYKISEFLELNTFNWNVFKDVKVFKGDYHSQIDPETEAFLKQFYKDSNERLYKLTGIDYR